VSRCCLVKRLEHIEDFGGRKVKVKVKMHHAVIRERCYATERRVDSLWNRTHIQFGLKYNLESMKDL
jgi:hypothetical protein